MSKTRSDSLLSQLTEEQQTQVYRCEGESTFISPPSFRVTTNIPSIFSTTEKCPQNQPRREAPNRDSE